MKTLMKISTVIAAVAFLSSCSSNRDMVSLDEYDDLYYRGSDRVAAQPVQGEFSGDIPAGSAESAYYGSEGYNEGPSDAEPTAKSSDDEYYDPDYARRIENFHRSDEPTYIYSRAYSPTPRLSMSMGYGTFGRYGGFGLSYGYGSSFYSPYYYMDPWRMGYAYYNPFYYRYRPALFYDPWMPYGYYAPMYAYHPYRYYGYGYPGYWGGGYPYYGGGYGDGGYHSNTEFGPRDDTHRSSRGGVVRAGQGSGVSDGPKAVESERTRTSGATRERGTETREGTTPRSEYFNPNERDRVLREQPDVRTTPAQRDSRIRDNAGDTRTTPATRPRSSDPVTSPYTRERNRTLPTPANRQRTTPAPTNRTTRPTAPRNQTAPMQRTRPSNNYTAPSNNRMRQSAPSSSPTMRTSPSRSSGGSGTRSTTPSRSNRSR